MTAVCFVHSSIFSSVFPDRCFISISYLFIYCVKIREVATLSRLQHQHVVRYYQVELSPFVAIFFTIETFSVSCLIYYFLLILY